jgi:PPK2 family polyphosphate:nucleotide phosphotransferase
MRRKPVPSPYLVGFDGKFKLSDASTVPPRRSAKKEELEAELAALSVRLGTLQRILYAQDQYAFLIIFQAMDAAGKDGTIRAVFSGVDPTGCQVTAFKTPSGSDYEHDFLFRTTAALPERGRIGVFNRSYYEEVLTVRVHPEYLERSRIPGRDRASIWRERLESIRHHELHLRRNGTVIVKFWLYVSRDEQKRRLLERLDDREKYWKFDPNDLSERRRWEQHLHAYQEAVAATSRREAPWYVIPADHKAFMRVAVSSVIVATLEGLHLAYPTLSPEERERRSELRALLEGD